MESSSTQGRGSRSSAAIVTCAERLRATRPPGRRSGPPRRWSRRSGEGGAGAQVAVGLVLQRTDIVPLDASVARVIGRMLARSRTSDPIDAHVVLLARERGWPVLTSDPDDLLAIDPTIVVETV
ncbi:MAG: PIN domain-containing protein [Sandaracinus sp.]